MFSPSLSAALLLSTRKLQSPLRLQTFKHSTTTTTTTTTTTKSRAPAPPITTALFWKDPSAWRRASSNTLRCLVGCTLGDFSALFYLQSHYPALPPTTVMAASMTAGIATSILLETIVLKKTEGMSLRKAFTTATNMSLISMVTMEVVENAVDWHLTGGMVQLREPGFWLAALTSMGAGYSAALPYNYWQLRKFGKSCH